MVFDVPRETLSLVEDVQRKTAARVEEHHQFVRSKPRLEFLEEIKRKLCETSAVRHLMRYLLTEVSEIWKRSGLGCPSLLLAEASLNCKEYH
ncbi:MAG: hypothetical protein LBS77_04160 [Desulfovibrio sp.]|nr:hypothetical protein [Desulfovibrio sp.]